MTRLTRLSLRIASAALALLIVWGLGEVLVRLAMSRTLIYSLEMVKYAKELKIRDPEGVNTHVHRPNASATLMGVEISLNSLGHRGPEPIARAKDARRVLVVGNSITMGWGVPQDRTFSALVEARLNAEKPFGPLRFQFENSGVGNYDTLSQLNLLKRQYARVDPDAIVLQYFINDAAPRERANDGFILEHSYLADFLYDRARVARLRLEGRSLAGSYAALYDGENGAWAKTRARIEEMAALARAHRIPFVVMIVPDVHDLAPGTPYAAIYAKIEKDLDASGIKTLNAFGAFQSRYGGNERELWIQPDDPHPNAAGHALMARLFYDDFVRENPLRLPRAR